MLPADFPNSSGELAAPFGWGFVDHFSAGVVCAPRVPLRCGDVFPKSLGPRIELPGSSSLSGSGHRQTLTGVARPAQVAEIRWLLIPFVSVAVIYG